VSLIVDVESMLGGMLFEVGDKARNINSHSEVRILDVGGKGHPFVTDDGFSNPKQDR
jgi:hypothetical protein